MEIAEFDECSDGEMSIEDLGAFPGEVVFKCEVWVPKSEMEEAVKQRETELILVTASRDLKEKRNEELEMELERTKFMLREYEMSDRRLKFYGANECLFRENEELRMKNFEQEIKSKEDWKKIANLTIDSMYLKYKLKKQNGAGEEEAYEEVKRHILQLENLAEEKKNIIKDKEWSMKKTEKLLTKSLKKVAELEEKMGLDANELQNLVAEKSSLIEENQRLEEELKRVCTTMETMKKEERSRVQRLEDARCLIVDVLDDMIDESKQQPGVTGTKIGRILRKRVKMNEMEAMDLDNLDNTDTDTASVSSGEEYQPKRSRNMDIGIEPWKTTGRKSRRGRGRLSQRTRRSM